VSRVQLPLQERGYDPRNATFQVPGSERDRWVVHHGRINASAQIGVACAAEERDSEPPADTLRDNVLIGQYPIRLQTKYASIECPRDSHVTSPPNGSPISCGRRRRPAASSARWAALPSCNPADAIDAMSDPVDKVKRIAHEDRTDRPTVPGVRGIRVRFVSDLVPSVDYSSQLRLHILARGTQVRPNSLPQRYVRDETYCIRNFVGMLKALPPVGIAYCLIQPLILIDVRERSACVRERNAERKVSFRCVPGTAMDLKHAKANELVHEVVQGAHSEHEGGSKDVGYVNRARCGCAEMFTERDEFSRTLHVLVELIKSRLHHLSKR
jgi:hypothetical protein